MKTPAKLLFIPVRLALLLTAGLAASALTSQAQVSATGVFTATPLGGGVFDYSITLNNTGSSALQTFWFSWVPGFNYMPASPISVTPPSGWSQITEFGPGYSILYYATTTSLLGGASLVFDFTSTLTPAQMAGNAFGAPIGTSFVSTGPVDSGTQYGPFVVTPVPEPSSSALFLAGSFGLLGMASLRRKTS